LRGNMIRICLLPYFAFFAVLSLPMPLPQLENRPLEKSPYFAFVDRDYIFTIEVVKPGVPLLNFVSMTEQDIRFYAKNVRLSLENRKEAVRFFVIETGDVRQPMKVASMTIHPRSSFGLRIEGDFSDALEFFGATIRLGSEDLELAPLTYFEFESLVLKVNRINLASPDFRDDWRVLRLERLGSRASIKRKRY
jgi:hypothetical protein